MASETSCPADCVVLASFNYNGLLCHCDRAARSADAGADSDCAGPRNNGDAMMSQFQPQNTHDADSIIAVFKAGLPLGFLGLVVGVIWHIAEVCHERTWGQRAAVILTSGAFGLVIGPIAFHLVPLFLPDATLSTSMAICCLVAAMGPQGMTMLLRFLKGCSIVTLKSPEDIEEERKRLTPEERAIHADNCPFEKDRYAGACITCPCSKTGRPCKIKESKE